MKRSLLLLALCSPVWARPLPYEKAGLTSYQAAAHMLSRFSYGARPGEVERVVHQGLEHWLESQLSENLDDSVCNRRLQAYPALAMNSQQIQDTYLAGPELRRLATQAGMMEKNSSSGDTTDKRDTGAKGDNGAKGDAGAEDTEARRRRKIQQFARMNDLQTERELLRQALAQKLTRCIYSEYQLREVMTDFWFNHFNVSRTTNPARPHILSYERDVIRPQSLGNFRNLLGSTARHPAMLLYLNNAQSVANPQAPRLSNFALRALQSNGKRQLGLNENYARELMELHTLGVDGGYSQKDVTEVARILTGWTTLPRGPMGKRLEQISEQYPQEVKEGPYGFLFVPFLHDAGPKSVLGSNFPAGQGESEGDRLLDLLASHPRTAERIARKFAVRFVSDEPDPKLVKDLAQVFRRSGGSSKAMLLALVESPQFWSAQALRAKVKNPIEYTVSSVRALGGRLEGPESQLPQWIDKMGLSMYGCVPPTGYPDKSEQWISSGTLIHRVNFAFALATQQVRGVRVQLPSGQLEQLAEQLLAGRPLDKALGPIRQTMANEQFFSRVRPELPEGQETKSRPSLQLSQGEKMVGVLVSSPEFQRR